MQRYLSITLLLLVLLASLIGCKTKTIDDAINTQIPYDVTDIIHQEQISNDKIMVFYTLEDEVEHEGKLNKVKDICNVAFFRGSNEDGWEIADDDGWSKFVNKDMETYDDTFFFKEDGASKVMYGRINNPEIVRVEIGNDRLNTLIVDTAPLIRYRS